MQTLRPNPDPSTTKLDTDADVEHAHRKLANHAFQCGRKFADTYRQCRDEGFSYYASYTRAVKAHDESVLWIIENVSLR